MINKKRRKINRIVLLIGLGFIVVFGLNKTKLFNPIKSFVEQKIVIPIRVQRYSRLSDTVNIQELLDKDLNNASELKATQLLEENRQLKNMLGISLPKNWTLSEAPVIEFSNDKLIIAMGEKQGIKIDMVALISEDRPLLVGKVSSVSENQAVISLPSDYDSRLSVVIVPSDSNSDTASVRGRGLAVGYGEGELIVNQILGQENISTGDLVGYRVNERLLYLGVVKEITTNNDGVFKSAKIEPVFVPFKLLNVFILTN